jgi:hypothetical protein
MRAFVFRNASDSDTFQHGSKLSPANTITYGFSAQQDLPNFLVSEEYRNNPRKTADHTDMGGFLRLDACAISRLMAENEKLAKTESAANTGIIETPDGRVFLAPDCPAKSDNELLGSQREWLQHIASKERALRGQMRMLGEWRKDFAKLPKPPDMSTVEKPAKIPEFRIRPDPEELAERERGRALIDQAAKPVVAVTIACPAALIPAPAKPVRQNRGGHPEEWAFDRLISVLKRQELVFNTMTDFEEWVFITVQRVDRKSRDEGPSKMETVRNGIRRHGLDQFVKILKPRP